MSPMRLDAHGFPILMSDTIVELVSTPDASGDAGVRQRPSADEAARRRDAVREAAREMEPLKEQDIKERLRGVTNRPLAADEIAVFVADVRAQVIDDMIDVLDQMVRGKLRGRRTLRLSSPRGYVRKTLHDMSDDDLIQVSARLRARGWDDDMVAHGFSRRLSRKRLDAVASRL